MPPAPTAPSASQRWVITTLKRLGEATADELATELGVSASAVRQHLGALRAAGLVEARREQGRRGRPAERYRATVRTEPLVAGDADDLSVELLARIEHEAPELVEQVFDRRRSQLVDDSRARIDGATIEDRIAQVSELMDEQGYLTDFERIADGHYRINLHNCAIWNVASRLHQACSSELDFLQGLLPDATVERITHKTAGAHTCSYDVHLRG